VDATPEHGDSDQAEDKACAEDYARTIARAVTHGSTGGGPETPDLLAVERLRIVEVGRPFDVRRLGRNLAEVETHPDDDDIEAIVRPWTEGVPVPELLRDALFAVFDEGSGSRVSAWRALCPNIAPIRASIVKRFEEWAAYFSSRSHTAAQILTMGKLISESLDPEVGMVADRLRAVLDRPEKERPLVRAYGIEIATRTLLLGGIGFEGDPRVHQLFPIALMNRIVAATRTPSGMWPGIPGPTSGGREPSVETPTGPRA